MDQTNNISLEWLHQFFNASTSFSLRFHRLIAAWIFSSDASEANQVDDANGGKFRHFVCFGHAPYSAQEGHQPGAQR